ncbi:hypothetical protein SDC9_174850 [bioreactor metagenome]|uniref:Uncharacterized protein n=1 Tax=bioreactor metagenome TaxID=1076179 RepID=A0A645GKK3_9ZZZZ
MAEPPEGGDLFDQFRMRFQFQPEETGGGVEGDVVPGGAEPAGDDQRVRLRQGFGEGGVDFRRAVPGGQSLPDGQAPSGQRPAEEGEIGVEDRSFQKFGSGRDDCDAHILLFTLLSPLSPQLPLLSAAIPWSAPRFSA